MRSGTYTITYDSGGPPGAKLKNITPEGSRELTGNDSAVFTLNFESTNKVMVNAMLDGELWEGSIDFRLEPAGIDGSAVPFSRDVEFAEEYTLTYLGGGPSHAFLKIISPSATQTAAPGDEINYTLEFVSKGTITVDSSIRLPTGWNGECAFEITGETEDGTITLTGAKLPSTFYDLPPGIYTLNYLSGAPEGYEYHDAVPQTLVLTENTQKGAFNVRFVRYQVVSPNPVGTDIAVTGVGAPTGANSGQYTITVTNNGPLTATGIVVRILLPASEDTPPPNFPVTFVGSDRPGEYNNATDLWTIPALAPGASITLTIDISYAGAVTPLETFTATVQIIGLSLPDMNASNDNAIIVITT